MSLSSHRMIRGSCLGPRIRSFRFISHNCWPPRADQVRSQTACSRFHEEIRVAEVFTVAPTIIRVLPVVISVMAGSGMLARVQAQSSGDAVPPAARFERLSEFFENEVTTGKLPGAIVLIQQHGLPIYLKCFGMRDVATKEPMTPDTIFALHSMTKPITSLAAMMLIDEGKLALADPVSNYIPAFSAEKVGVESVTKNGEPIFKLVPPNRPVSIEDLLRQTSGISYEYIGGEWMREASSEAQLFAGDFGT